MTYQPCRWYDAYPGLAFVLKLIQLMPLDQQEVLGQRLNQFLQHRSVSELSPMPNYGPVSNRWYDQVMALFISLERLKTAPAHVKQQSADYLLELVKEIDQHSHCA